MPSPTPPAACEALPRVSPTAGRRPRAAAAMGLACLVALGCRSLSYDEPDEPPRPPTSAATASAAAAAEDESWSALANAAQRSLREGDLDEAEQQFLACIAATDELGDRDVRRLASLALPARLAERHQANADWEGAARITDAVLAEAQGGNAFPLDAWSHALQTRLEIDRLHQGPEAQLELARQIAEIHLGPIGDATIAEVTLRQRVGRLLAEHGETAAAATQLGWAARAAEQMLRLGLDDRLALLFEAAALSERAGDPTTADFLLREAVELALRSAPESLSAASALNQRGWFLVEQGRPHAALEPLEQAAAIVREESASPGLTAATLDSLAVALHRAGRLDEAAAVFDEALAAREGATPEERAALSMLDDHKAALERDRAGDEAGS